VLRLAADVNGIDVLVNNAGASPTGPTHDRRWDVFDADLRAQRESAVFLTGALAPRTPATGGGAIVNVTTTVATVGMAGMALYGSTKVG
jgi:NAD(P)-dependent dehydrogenase (short-subunit alcohol dehydrogenase family)